MDVQAIAALVSNRFDLHRSVCFVDIVEDSKAIHRSSHSAKLFGLSLLLFRVARFGSYFKHASIWSMICARTRLAYKLGSFECLGREPDDEHPPPSLPAEAH